MDITYGDRIIRIADRHSGYEREIRKHFDTYFNSVLPQITPQGALADFSGTAVHTYPDGKDFLLSSLPEEADTIAASTIASEILVPVDDAGERRRLAFDVGAYCGVSTYHLSQRYERVIAFEPDEDNRRCLRFNIDLHKLKNVVVVPLAMTGTGAPVKFFSEGALGSRIAKPEYTRGPFVTVGSMTLSGACAMYGVPDFIAMDIEGEEVEVLDTSRDLLSRNNISLCVDTNHDECKGYTYGRVEFILSRCGYKTETKTPGGLYTTYGWKGQS